MVEQLPHGLLNALTIYCSNSALMYVSFPLQALFKSSKIMGVILFSMVNPYSRSESHTKWKLGLFFTVGIFLFNYFKDSTHDSRSNSFLGILLLVASLFIDGALPDYQSYFKKKHNTTAVLLYNITSKWSFIIFLAIAVVFGEIGTTI